MPRSGGKLEFEPILIADFEDWIALNSSKIIDKKRQGTSHFGKIGKKRFESFDHSSYSKKAKLLIPITSTMRFYQPFD
jgi:hypothetical protein